MAAKPVQISIDDELLERIDADPEARRKGRSAFLRAAASFYLAAKERRAIDEQIERAYRGHADAMMEEIADLVEAQEWHES